MFHDNPAAGVCGESPSGEDIDGGFGWLSTDASCFAPLEGGWIQGETSVDPPTNNEGCDMATLYDLLQGEIPIPVFDYIEGKDGGGGANARYHIHHFVTFQVTDFKIYTDTRYQGHTTVWNDPSCLRLGGGGMQTVCMDGYFTGHDLSVEQAGSVKVEFVE